MKNLKKYVILKGEGINQHVLHGNFSIIESDFPEITVVGKTKLSHETPSGAHAEHHTLPVNKKFYIRGNQLEYNPFANETHRVWD